MYKYITLINLVCLPNYKFPLPFVSLKPLSTFIILTDNEGKPIICNESYENRVVHRC